MDFEKHIILFRINIQNLRKLRGLSQQEVSKKTSISIRKYQRLESGEATPSLDDICALANAFDVSPVELLDLSQNAHQIMIIPEEELKFSKCPQITGLRNFVHEHIEKKYNFEKSPKELYNVFLKDHVFMNHQQPFAVSDFNNKIYNNAYTKTRENIKGNIEKQLVFVADQFKFLATFSFVCKHSPNFFRATVPVEVSKNKIEERDYILYFNHNISNLFHFVTPA